MAKTSRMTLPDNFNNTFEYLDYVLAFNNPEFPKFAKEIYQKELILNTM